MNTPPKTYYFKIRAFNSNEVRLRQPIKDLLYFGLPTLWKRLILGKTEGKRRKGWQRMKWLGSITDSMDMNLSKFREIMEDTRAWYATGDNRGGDGWMASLTQWT